MIFDVRDYGATGNGTGDDTLAIQAAVDAAHAAGGGTVYIPAGTYLVTGHEEASDGAILLYDNITVTGDGMGATTVRLKDGWSGDITGIFRTPTDVENHDVTVRGLTIDGNRDNTSGKVDGWFNGVSPGEPGTDRNITLDHVEIKDCSGYGFDPHEQTTNLVITNCVSHGNGLDGFTLDYQIDAHVENNVAYDNDRHGFNIVTSSRDVTLVNNIAYGNGDNGVIVQRGSDDIPVPDNIVIQGGSLYDNGNDGVQINKADHVTVDGVDIYGNAERGVRVIGSTGSVIENSTIHDNSASKNLAYEEVRIEAYDDTDGVSGHIYETTGTVIANNTIYDEGAVRGSYSVREYGPNVDYTTVSNNTIYATGEDRPLLLGAHSSFSQPSLDIPPTHDPNAPHILYAPLLGQSNAEMMKTVNLADGGSGLSHVESGLQSQAGYDRVVTMVNMAVGGSTVDGDRGSKLHPELVWWYPDQNKPGPALLEAVDQMQHQLAELRAEGYVTPIVIWAQGEAEANQLGTSKSDGGRRTAEQEYIDSTRLVFNYIQDHVGHDVQFYIVETGNFNTQGAVAYGYPQFTIDKENLGLTYVRDAQIKMALAYDDVHLAANYSDLPMRADMPSSTPGWGSDWASDAWHLAPSSQEIAGDRISNFIALDMGKVHVLDDPGPYPRAALADLTLYNGPGLTVSGNAHNNIITGTLANDTISGGSGDDVIVAGGGQDRLTGGAGADTFYFHPSDLQNLAGTKDTITDFQAGAGGDAVDVSALLRAAGYTGNDPVAAGYIKIAQQGADTVISFDRDGTGSAYAAVPIAVLSGVNAASFSLADNLVTQFPSGNALVLPAHQPPWAQDDSFTGIFGQQVQGNVLANNGQGADSSPDGLALSTVAQTIATAGGGTVTITAAGAFTYTPATGFVGTDSFTYGLRDSQGGKDTGTVTLSVNAPAGAISGTEGSDALTGGSKADIMLGKGGDDVLSGGSNNDTIYAGAGNDTLNGNAGNDTLYAMSGNNVLNGNDDDDILYAGSGNDTLIGGNGNDKMITAGGTALMTGGKGMDTFVFTKVPVTAHTVTDFFSVNGDKIDVSQIIFYSAQSSSPIGDYVQGVQQGGDTMLRVDADGALNGANFVDVALLRGVQGFDAAALVASGNLAVDSGAGSSNHPPVAKDDAFTVLADTQMHGNVLQDNGAGADSDPDGQPLGVSAWSGATSAGGAVSLQADGTFTYMPKAGFAGTDSFVYTLMDDHGGSAHGTVSLAVSGGLNGTSGDDVITGCSRDDVIHGQGGNDTVNGGSGNDTIYGDAGNDNLNGNSGDDILYAVSGNDVVHGNDGNDTLYAGTGSDMLYGDNGNDLLVAAFGGDILTGGGGADTFKFVDTGGAVNTVTDFRTSVGDRLDIQDILSFETGMNISDFVHTAKQGTGVIVSVDADGAASGAHFTDLVLLDGVSSFDPATMLANGSLIA